MVQKLIMYDLNIQSRKMRKYRVFEKTLRKNTIRDSSGLLINSYKITNRK